MTIEQGNQQSEVLNPFEPIADRSQRLAAINQFLTERKLRPLKNVGNFEDPNSGTELFEILQVYDRPQRFYTVVSFKAKFGPTAEGEYNLIFKANGQIADGSAYITRIQSADGTTMYLLTDQYRIALDERMTEIPRGFAKGTDVELSGQEFKEPLDLESTPADIPIVRVLRELREETGIKKIKSFKHLGKIAEDSSIGASDFNVYLVGALSELSQQELEASEIGTVRVFMTPREIYGGFQEGKIRDVHSLSAFFTAILKDPDEGKRFAQWLLEK